MEKIKEIHIRGIHWLLEVVFRISNEAGENLLREAGLELVKDRIKRNRNHHAIIQLLETIEKISEPFFLKLSLDIDFYKKKQSGE